MSGEKPSNPLAAGMSDSLMPAPCSLVIFGGSGDLSRRKLLPAIYNLAVDGLLPANFAVLGFATRDLGDGGFRSFAGEAVEKFSRQQVSPEFARRYEQALFYTSGRFDDPEAYKRLRERLAEIEPRAGVTGNRIFYLSIPPAFIGTCVRHLKGAGLIAPPGAGGRFTRVIVEKPIGQDIASAREINATLSSVLAESQIYRIDHYLGKETVQNGMVIRFANSFLEPLWNQKYVDHVQITASEEVGVGSRWKYYETAGALRDMVQNHILQLLCVAAMEPPSSMDPDVIRNAKVDVLKSLRPIRQDAVDDHVVRAQYSKGVHLGSEVPGYRDEEGVRRDSVTETYVALKAYVDNWRWAGVPFYMRTGKRMPKRVSEISVQFKAVPPILFNRNPAAPLEPNVLTLRIQPDEGMSLRIASKVPGAGVTIYPVLMDFRYGTTFGKKSPEAYERLLLDVMSGDATLFQRRDSVEASWTWIQDILDAWDRSGAASLPEYPAGSWGPPEADRLLAVDGHKWRKP